MLYFIYRISYTLRSYIVDLRFLWLLHWKFVLVLREEMNGATASIPPLQLYTSGVHLLLFFPLDTLSKTMYAARLWERNLLELLLSCNVDVVSLLWNQCAWMVLYHSVYFMLQREATSFSQLWLVALSLRTTDVLSIADRQHLQVWPSRCETQKRDVYEEWNLTLTETKEKKSPKSFIELLRVKISKHKIWTIILLSLEEIVAVWSSDTFIGHIKTWKDLE